MGMDFNRSSSASKLLDVIMGHGIADFAEKMDKKTNTKLKKVYAQLNDDQKKRLQEIRSTLDWLSTHFPKAFAQDPKAIKALKIGIDKDIIATFSAETVISKSKLRQAIKYYTGHHCYQKLLQTQGSPRIDLEGKVIDSVSAEHAEMARTLAEKRKKPTRPPKAPRQATARNAKTGRSQPFKNTPVIKVKRRRKFSRTVD